MCTGRFDKHARFFFNVFYLVLCIFNITPIIIKDSQEKSESLCLSHVLDTWTPFSYTRILCPYRITIIYTTLAYIYTYFLNSLSLTHYKYIISTQSSVGQKTTNRNFDFDTSTHILENVFVKQFTVYMGRLLI